MRLSTKGRYAVRAMVDLAANSKGAPISLKEISGRQGISLSYLEQLFYRMRKEKIISSMRGPTGGYVLARPTGQLTLAEIIESVEETVVPVECLETIGPGQGCDREAECLTRIVWEELSNRIAMFLGSITLADLCKDAQIIREEIKQKGCLSRGTKSS